ncbi:RNA polymerase sigma-70 factor [Pseudoflavitalea sp. G-6-1-2]|uniref:RNA polymerase sigma factor n=1 Tax=Pseudoflavitalea sp. G-6-1-2 TaxID=2728841 RepID=UPI001469DA6D|nr:RNA polymerase sigma-70 factor [Pseudoflavitalea sp. G-6-1-2]NML22561.1 RNA polymerase sigma-70 factor [Pseudoflavitalea sp. G-6-1-2]
MDLTPPYNEPLLLQQVAEGNSLAFRQLFDQYQRRVYSYSFKITNSHEVTEDIVQDVFLEIWNIRHRLHEIENFNAYLHRIAHSKVYRSLQRVAREELVLQHLKQQGTPVDEAGKPLLSKEITHFIQSLVEQLTPRQREVFLLSREEGLKYEEIAQRMGIGFETVKSHLANALKFLRSEIGKQYGSQAIAILIIWELTAL